MNDNNLNKKKVDIILLVIANPLLIGIYEKDNLIKSFTLDGKISDTLVDWYKGIKGSYDINSFIYTNSPGTFLSIKLTYLFLKTVCLIEGISIKAVDGFYFNENNPIKGIFSQQFVKKNGKIAIEKVQQANNTYSEFNLPIHIDKKDFCDDIEPIYIIPFAEKMLNRKKKEVN